ncbi:hypothetical protein HS961_15490 [Comamonas piscis]|uniref:Uncharacterized protein n=1 Tax=Comamonas piscis TaxID=1562974 RepID=A0A7G5EJF4_9BURK|nr:hypothetical protein [Comamonas piscis]QMV74129.1 hypothetical protein HS961_15490 [Comamonas piscis]WSO32569.1 hypothetical protein VUJ63_15535 [Comamonas piscis]
MFLFFSVCHINVWAQDCSNQEYGVFIEYDKLLDKYPTIAESEIRNRVAAKIGISPAALKDLYFRCLLRWKDEPRGQKDTSLVQDTARTKSLSCKTLGYRFGHTATRSAQGRTPNKDWNFVMPSRCTNKSETNAGIKEGVVAAQK